MYDPPFPCEENCGQEYSYSAIRISSDRMMINFSIVLSQTFAVKLLNTSSILTSFLWIGI